jgi:cyclohexa-1,5-dienecarbonyl-CoA hydratase
MSDNKEQPLITLQIEEGVGRLTLNRPPLNILNIEMLVALESALEKASEDQTLRILVLQANGRLFSAGVDIGDHTAERVNEMIPLVGRVCHALATFPSPTLAVVHGHALGGGCELVLCCDMSVAAENAKIGQPEIKLATFAPIAALRLPALVGHALAAELLFTGESLLASEAVRFGLVNRAVPADELEAAASTIITGLQNMSAVALRLSKKALILNAPTWDGLAAIEALYLQDLMSTADVHEGLAAYQEKRSPNWQHH